MSDHDAVCAASGVPNPGADPAPIRWSGEPQRYSPVQDRRGLRDPEPGTLPPATERVTQRPEPLQPETLDGREVLRVTYQGDDRCQLACPGCYTGDRLNLPLADSGRGRQRISHEDFLAQMAGFRGLQDFYLIGAEATMDPDGSAAKLRWAREQGYPLMLITHGATSPAVFERTFGEALDSGAVYCLTISLDSMDPAVHNDLRGRSFAHTRTLRVLDHALQRGAPVKVQMTVWPKNFATILDSVRELHERGVRGFSFHAGSLESDTCVDPRYGHAHVDPLAWRALAEQLWAFRQKRREQLWMFNVPWLFYSAAELRGEVIGDAELTDQFLDHVDRLDRGQDSVKPVHACPALDVPQVYVYANDGPNSQGQVSLCNIHADPQAGAVADFNSDVGQWQVIQDEQRNQLAAMADSPHLCPATPYALRRDSDRIDTEVGPLYHACRYLASNQVPIDTTQFGRELYETAVDYYRLVALALQTYPTPEQDSQVHEWPIQRIQRLSTDLALVDRAATLRADLATYTGHAA